MSLTPIQYGQFGLKKFQSLTCLILHLVWTNVKMSISFFILFPYCQWMNSKLGDFFPFLCFLIATQPLSANLRQGKIFEKCKRTRITRSENNLACLQILSHDGRNKLISIGSAGLVWSLIELHSICIFILSTEKL